VIDATVRVRLAALLQPIAHDLSQIPIGRQTPRHATSAAIDSWLTPRRNIPVAGFQQRKLDRDDDRPVGDGFQCQATSS
jgi:hypothetical protein